MAVKGILNVTSILNEYSEDIQEAITQDSIKVAKKGANRLKLESPKVSGGYAKGWSVKTTKTKGSVSSVVHNSKKWQLTHLLEKPHIIRNKYGRWGTYYPKKQHIYPVEQDCIKEYETDVENIIKNGV